MPVEHMEHLYRMAMESFPDFHTIPYEHRTAIGLVIGEMRALPYISFLTSRHLVIFEWWAFAVNPAKSGPDLDFQLPVQPNMNQCGIFTLE